MNSRQTKFVCIDHLDFEIWPKRFFFFDEYVEDFFLSEETKLSKNVGQIKIEAGYL